MRESSVAGLKKFNGGIIQADGMGPSSARPGSRPAGSWATGGLVKGIPDPASIPQDDLRGGQRFGEGG